MQRYLGYFIAGALALGCQNDHSTQDSLASDASIPVMPSYECHEGARVIRDNGAHVFDVTFLNENGVCVRELYTDRAPADGYLDRVVVAHLDERGEHVVSSRDLPTQEYTMRDVESFCYTSGIAFE